MAVDIHTVAGVAGSAMIIGAYFANQQEWLSAKDWRYSFVNLLGALLILLSLYFDWNLAAVVMEGFWAAISVYGLMRQLRLKQQP